MIKVWYTTPTYIEGFETHSQTFLTFDTEPQHFLHEPNFIEADIIPLKYQCSDIERANQISFLKSNNYKNDQLIVILNLFHLDSTYGFFKPDDLYEYDKKIIKSFEDNSINNVIIVHSLLNYKHKNLVFYDILWNRQKIYFTDYYKTNLKGRLWTNSASQKCFKLNPIEKREIELRKFLMPNRIYYFLNEQPRTQFRTELDKFIQQYKDDGFVSNPLNGELLLPEEETLVAEMNIDTSRGGGKWFPIKNEYYERSFFSVYVETLTTSEVWFQRNLRPIERGKVYPRSITEKTWDPLIKGHFILPFGYPGLIEDIKSYGFKLPDFIDYSYDNEHDDFIRFEKFCKSLEHLLSISIDEWQTLFAKYMHILVHNRSLFYEKPYSSLYDKLKPYFDK